MVDEDVGAVVKQSGRQGNFVLGHYLSARGPITPGWIEWSTIIDACSQHDQVSLDFLTGGSKDWEYSGTDVLHASPANACTSRSSLLKQPAIE
jgi:hypothetical protein